MNPCIILLLAVLSVGVPLRADDSGGLQAYPLPPGTLCSPIPVQTECHITFTYSSGGAALNSPSGGQDAKPIPIAQLGQMPPADIIIRRTGSVWHGTLTDTVGRVTDCWSDGLTNFLIPPGSHQPNPTSEDGMVLFSEFLHFEGMKVLPGFDWVSPANYRGVQTIAGATCLVFRQGDTTVWVNADSRLPVQWVQGLETRKIAFHSSFTTQVTLPPDIAAMAKGIALSKANSNRKPPRGG